MYIRSILAILDHNFNLNWEVVGGVVNYSKASKQWVFKNRYLEKNNSWKTEFLQIILNYDSQHESLEPMDFEVIVHIFSFDYYFT
jgi:hypothetical protein